MRLKRFFGLLYFFISAVFSGFASAAEVDSGIPAYEVSSGVSGNLSSADMRIDNNFGFMVPKFVSGIDNKILNPRDTWSNTKAYDTQASKLINMFIENFKKFEKKVERNVTKRKRKQKWIFQ